MGIAIVFSVGSIVLALIFLWVATGTGRGFITLDELAPSTYRIRWLLFIVILILAIVALEFTLPQAPFVQFAHISSEGEPTVIQVVAYQYGWQMVPETIPVGSPVRFEMTSRDVNHGFAIYDSENRIVGQVQVIPGYTNSLALQFEKPGTYWIRCLELCGIFHHAMVQSFCVGSCDPS